MSEDAQPGNLEEDGEPSLSPDQLSLIELVQRRSAQEQNLSADEIKLYREKILAENNPERRWILLRDTMPDLPADPELTAFLQKPLIETGDYFADPGCGGLPERAISIYALAACFLPLNIKGREDLEEKLDELVYRHGTDADPLIVIRGIDQLMRSSLLQNEPEEASSYLTLWHENYDRLGKQSPQELGTYINTIVGDRFAMPVSCYERITMNLVKSLDHLLDKYQSPEEWDQIHEQFIMANRLTIMMSPSDRKSEAKFTHQLLQLMRRAQQKENAPDEMKQIYKSNLEYINANESHENYIYQGMCTLDAALNHVDYGKIFAAAPPAWQRRAIAGQKNIGMNKTAISVELTKQAIQAGDYQGNDDQIVLRRVAAMDRLFQTYRRRRETDYLQNGQVILGHFTDNGFTAPEVTEWAEKRSQHLEVLTDALRQYRTPQLRPVTREFNETTEAVEPDARVISYFQGFKRSNTVGVQLNPYIMAN